MVQPADEECETLHAESTNSSWEILCDNHICHVSVFDDSHTTQLIQHEWNSFQCSNAQHSKIEKKKQLTVQPSGAPKHLYS